MRVMVNMVDNPIITGRDCNPRDPIKRIHVRILTQEIAVAERKQLEWKVRELELRRELRDKYGVFVT